MPYKFNPFTGNLDIEGPIITGSGTVSAAADGTAQVPGINFANDLNTGIYRPGADQVAISTGGTGRLFITSAGVIQTAASGQIETISSAGDLTLYGGSTNKGGGIRLGGGNADADVRFYAQAYSSTPAERLRITSSGNVGIGTSAPTDNLHISSSGLNPRLKVESTGSSSYPGVRIANPAKTYDLQIDGASGGLRFYDSTANAERIRIDSAGKVGIGTLAPGSILHVLGGVAGSSSTATFQQTNTNCGQITLGLGTAGYGFTLNHDSATTGTTIYNSQHTGAGGHVFKVNNAERMRIDSSGNVGIGTSSPSSLLSLYAGANSEYFRGGGNGVTTRDLVISASTGTNAGDTHTINASGSTGRLILSTASSPRVTVDSSGNVGIGGNPTTQLHLLAPSGTYNRAEIGFTARNAGNSLLPFAKIDARHAGQGVDSSNFAIHTTDGSGVLNEVATFLYNGNVGIGTSAPLNQLTLSNSSNQLLGFETSSEPTIQSYNADLHINTAGNDVLFDGSGNVGIGTTSPGTKLHVVTSGAGAIRHADGTRAVEMGSDGSTSYVGSITAGQALALYADGGEKARITSGGRLGIGMSNPQELLHLVSGSISGTVTGGIAIGSIANQPQALIQGYRTNGSFSGELIFSTSGSTSSSMTERMRLDSAGNVGIGASGGAAGFGNVLRQKPSGGASGYFAEGANSDTWLGLYSGTGTSDSSALFFPSTGSFRIGSTTATGTTGFSEKLRIDSSGRLLVGTSTSTSVAGSAATVQIDGVGSNPHSLQLTRSDAPILAFGKTNSASGSSLGAILFAGHDTNDINSIGASITGEIDGTVGVDDMPGRLVFSTTADGASSPTERMRITSDGAVCINRQSAIVNSKVSIQGDGTNTVIGIQTGHGTGTLNALQFLDSGGAVCGEITVDATANTTSYGTSSDYRLKENVAAIDNPISRLSGLKPCRFNFISDPGKTFDGFLAHEAQAIVPEAVNRAKDQTDEDGNPEYQTIDQSKLVPLLTAALQEAIAKIETLETKVAALEAN